jgi:hypothetical protein
MASGRSSLGGVASLSKTTGAPQSAQRSAAPEFSLMQRGHRTDRG